MILRARFVIGWLVVVACGFCSPAAFGQGLMLSSSGPINRSMGGAAVAAPLDAIGAIRWNPATISGLPCSELGFGADLVWPIAKAQSSITGLAEGTTYADPGVSAIPSIGWVHKLEDSPITVGLGLMGVAGFRTNYPASLTNPVFLPQSNTPGVPGGLGRVYTEAQFLDLAPVVSMALTDSFSVGVSPIISLGEVVVDPLVIAPPDDADGSGQPRYPSSAGTHMQWGAGVQLGAYYIASEEWRFGASVRTPTWMRAIHYQSQDEAGAPQSTRFVWDLPLVVGTGVSYAGFAQTLIALDLRYIDYANTSGWGDSGFNPDGSLRGVGWKGAMGVALGIQRELTETLTARVGYTYTQNPTPQSMTSINVAAPLHYQHEIGLGASYLIASNVALNMAYTYYLPHEITGPIVTPAGPVPGSSVTSTLSVHVATLGLTVRY